MKIVAAAKGFLGIGEGLPPHESASRNHFLTKHKTISAALSYVSFKISISVPPAAMNLYLTPLLLMIAQSLHGAPRLHISPDREISPESKIEVVLDQTAVADDGIGKPAATPWIEVSPAWKGEWKWREANVLAFTPAEPPRHHTEYQFSLLDGHAHLDGSALTAAPLGTRASEPFRIENHEIVNDYEDPSRVRQPKTFLLFNDEISPESAVGFMYYEATDGLRMAAQVTRATVGSVNRRSYLIRPSWEERFASQVDAQEIQVHEWPAEKELTNALIAEPARPLPVGKKWRLTLLAGLPNSANQAGLAADSSVGIGTIEALEVREIAAVSPIDSPRYLQVGFNLPLPKTFDPAWIEVTPRPENMRLVTEHNHLRIFGDLAGTEKWTVRVHDAVISQDGRALKAAASEMRVFEPNQPILQLVSEDETQLASGSLRYPIRTVNLKELRVRIKQLDKLQTVRASQGFRQYTGKKSGGEIIATGLPLPYSLIGGDTVLDAVIPLDFPLDTSKDVVIDWERAIAGDPQPWTIGSEPNEPAAKRATALPASLFIEVTGIAKSEIPTSKPKLTQALVQLTDIGLAWKTTADEAHVLAFSCLTGKPLAGVKVTILGEDAADLASATTGADGLAALPRLPAARHLQAVLAADQVTISYDETLPSIGLWRFPVRISYEGNPSNSRRVFLFTDRPLYRPGETVHLKGIVRRQDGNAIVFDENSKAELVVKDPQNRELFREPARINENGGFDLDFILPNAITGYHRFILEYPDELALAEATTNWQDQRTAIANGRFETYVRVEEFRRNAFEVTQETGTPAIAAREVVTDLVANYYQGQPVAGGEVENYTSVSSINFYPDRFRDYLFGDHRRPDHRYWSHYFGYELEGGGSGFGASHEDDETKLDADGKLRLTTAVPELEFPMLQEVDISTTVTDANQQTLSASSKVQVHPASVYAGIARIDKLVRAGDSLALELVAVTAEGIRHDQDLPVRVIISREINEQVRVKQGAGTAVRNETRIEELSIDDKTIAASGRTEINFAPREAGVHRIELRGTDADGREFATINSIHVYGGNDYPWAYEDGMRIQLVAEKRHYQPGETARVLVLSPIEGTALVTVEREKVLRTFQVELKADQPVIEIPLTQEEAPNVYVSVLVIKGAQESLRKFQEPQLRLGYCEISVENVRDRLEVALDLPSTSVLPGTRQTISGTVKLAGGGAADRAEVSLYAVDEGTLAVTGYETPKPLNHFDAPRSLEVGCGTSLDEFIAEDPSEKVFENKGFFIGGGGEEAFAMEQLRSDFSPTAGWLPTLVTDADGRFHAEFTMPDALTRYRVIAVVHHSAAAFGHAEGALTVNKPIMIEPQTPRFASQGDELEIQAMVMNRSEYAGTWEITFSPASGSGMQLARIADGTATGQLTLKPGESAGIVFPVRFEGTGEAVFEWSAACVSLDQTASSGAPNPGIAATLRDRVEARFPVTYPVPLMRETRLISLGRDPQNLLEGITPSLLNGRGQATLEISPSLLMEAAGSAEFLLEYPYGCVEQVSSSMVPWLAVDSLRSVVPAFANVTPERVVRALQQGVDQLLTMQTASGGFGYWPGHHNEVEWASSYAGLIMILARDQGASVPTASIEALCNSLETGLRGIGTEQRNAGLENACRAVWVLALARRSPEPYIHKLIDRLPELNPRARCLLALAIHSSDSDADARGILTSEVNFALQDDFWMRSSYNEAFKLLAWSEIDPKSEATTQQLVKLIEQRNPYGHWDTTWGNGWSILAMSAYASHQDPPTPANLTIDDGKDSKTVVIDPAAGVFEMEFPTGAELTSITASADADLFLRVEVAAKPEIAPQIPVAANGLEVTRFYERVLPSGVSEPLDRPKRGDLIRITLEIKEPKDNTRYLAIEDRLPSIFEAVNQDFKSQADPGVGANTSQNDWSISHSELRGDRAWFFLDFLPRGTHRITYLARCTMAGQAVAPPAKVEAMYHPQHTALSASRSFTSER